MDYYVLKQGRSEGPFSATEIVDQMAGGRFSPEDLAQLDGARHWTPLRRLFANNGSDDAPESEAPQDIASATPLNPPALPRSFAGAGKQWWRETSGGLQQLFRDFPFEMGMAFLALGCLLLLLTYARIFLVGPVLVGALYGGGISMLRGRVMAGLGLCAATVFVPALIWSVFFWAGYLLGFAR